MSEDTRVCLRVKADFRQHNRYRLLNEANRALAVETFGKNKDFYHPICRNLVEKDLFGSGTRS